MRSNVDTVHSAGNSKYLAGQRRQLGVQQLACFVNKRLRETHSVSTGIDPVQRRPQLLGN
jgi:hypothetical protein